MNLFSFSLKFKGFPLEKAKEHLTDIQNIDESAYSEYIENRKKEIVSYHLENNSFYKEFGKNIDIDDWNSVPIITKRDLQQPLMNRLSGNFNMKNIHIHKTSGSSGTPFIFAKDKFCHALTWATFIDRYNWFNVDLNTSKQARFYGIPLNKTGYYKERFKDFLGNRFRFSVFDMSDEALEIVLKKFRSTKFNYINGYTSAIVQFAKFLEKKNIVLKDVCHSLNVCIVTAEMLFESDKELLKMQLGIPIVNEYGSAELGLIAFNAPNGKWILNTEDLFVEILDENNQPLPYGKRGKIVVTSLYNKAHPFIRYEIGDYGSLSENSSLKKPILKNLLGRTNDFAILPSGKKAAGLTFYYVTKTVIEDNGNVKEFIIEQIQTDTFKIIYTSTEKLSQSKIRAINDAIEKYLESGLKILFERRETLKRTKAGKLKQFTSSLN
ncbi:phenylacetate--CoA ligase family protein [Seonamhaeicola marinus]|uniref:Phenylacetate--CoA ligase family protein n=1 Tax=Seonamhaeicola marinus TaxID=1912246 RepID=A0A5D0HUN4_9FLAO|nr:phenylacetate--CoA ligase family protein [Seonamhaeicola marinus]